MRQPEKMIIYNLFPLLAGNFTGWDSHLSRASEMGFNWVFVNPVNLPGFSGSLYSIKDYFDFNPLIGMKSKRNRKQIKETIRHAEKLWPQDDGNLVINHCALDSDLLKTDPGWFKGAERRGFSSLCHDNGKWSGGPRKTIRNTKNKEGSSIIYGGCKVSSTSFQEFTATCLWTKELEQAHH
jgi:starch synthase (maltosyl-transferring)